MVIFIIQLKINKMKTIEQIMNKFFKTLKNEVKTLNDSSIEYENGLTCMMCRKSKLNDGHTCCEECAGLAF